MRRVLLPFLALGLCGCMPAASGPLSLDLHAIADGVPWTPRDLLLGGQVPRGLLRPLPEALDLAPLGSVIVACQRQGAVWGLCTHMTRKVAPDLLTEETGALGTGARYRPLASLLERDVVFVLDTGIRPAEVWALRARAERLHGAPYRLNGEGDAFDCVTYQNELQRALGLPEAVPLNTRWNAHLPADALQVPTNRLIWVGVRDLSAVQGMNPPR